jgi:hypothetical protein
MSRSSILVTALLNSWCLSGVRRTGFRAFRWSSLNKFQNYARAGTRLTHERISSLYSIKKIAGRNPVLSVISYGLKHCFPRINVVA